MQKEVKIFSTIFLAAILIFSLASAIGNSEGLTRDKEEDPTIREQAKDAALEATTKAKMEAREQFRKKTEELRRNYAAKNCENIETKAERVKCRFILGEDYKAPEGTIPEACRLAENQERCKALYAATKNCFELEGKTKDACFKRALGIKKQLADEAPEERNQKAREYLVTLLYDLEERVEKASEENKIDPEDGAEIINKIVDIKGKILNGATKEEIRTEMQELKEMWRTALADAENVGLTAAQCEELGGFVYDRFGSQERECSEELGELSDRPMVEGPMLCCK